MYLYFFFIIFIFIQAEMSERPKRVISKPSRYKTTSSDEAHPPKQARIGRRISATEIQEDVQHIKRIIAEDSTYLHYNDNNSFTQDTHTYIQSP